MPDFQIINLIHYLVVTIIILPLLVTNNVQILYFALGLSIITWFNWLILGKCILTVIEHGGHEGFIYRIISPFIDITENGLNKILWIILTVLIILYIVKINSVVSTVQPYQR